MSTTLTTIATEESTYIITASFIDEDDNTVVPKSATWSLTDTSGTVINSRQNVVISSLAASVDIVLSGDDLIVDNNRNTTRILTIKAVYDSNSGSDLPLNDEIYFNIENLVYIT